LYYSVVTTCYHQLTVFQGYMHLHIGNFNYTVISFFVRVFIEITLKTSAQAFIVLEGQSVSLECTPTPDDLALFWTFNGIILTSFYDVTFVPPNLQHKLIVNNVNVQDSGQYKCLVAGNFLVHVNQTITLQVMGGMQLILSCMIINKIIVCKNALNF